MSLLVLTRSPGERTALDVRGVRVWVTVDLDRHGKIKLIIDAPREVIVTREEIMRALASENEMLRRADRD